MPDRLYELENGFSFGRPTPETYRMEVFDAEGNSVGTIEYAANGDYCRIWSDQKSPLEPLAHNGGNPQPDHVMDAIDRISKL